MVILSTQVSITPDFQKQSYCKTDHHTGHQLDFASALLNTYFPPPALARTTSAQDARSGRSLIFNCFYTAREAGGEVRWFVPLVLCFWSLVSSAVRSSSRPLPLRSKALAFSYGLLVSKAWVLRVRI